MPPFVRVKCGLSSAYNKPLIVGLLMVILNQGVDGLLFELLIDICADNTNTKDKLIKSVLKRIGLIS